MNWFGEAGRRRSWQPLSFKHKQTKAGALAAEQTRSRRLVRIGVAALSALTTILILGFGQADELVDWAIISGIVLLIHATVLLVIRMSSPELLYDLPAYLLQVILFVVLVRIWSELGFPHYLLPLPLLSMIVALTFGSAVALFTAIIAGGLASFQLAFGSITMNLESALNASSIGLPFTLFAGSVVAILGVERLRSRTRLVTVGILSGLIQAASIALFEWPEHETSTLLELTRWSPLIGLFNGLGSGILLTSALPFIERIFGLTTDMRLLELADQNRPLLRDLSLRAPGSFQHSLMVGQLSEEAAKSIGANDLLARVGALYHDIGKMLKPNYFVQTRAAAHQNMHDRLSPEMARLIIISHVKDGVRIAEEEGLPKPIIDMIPMHHGTSVVEYFYHKKRQQEEEQKNLGETRDEAFQYPGPKPTFKEAGILMLADTVEAISRVLKDPTPSRLRAVVKEVINKKMASGQLDECDLTLRDLSRIEDAFVRVLASIHHGRIKYPQQAEKETSGSEASQSPADNDGKEERPAAVESQATP